MRIALILSMILLASTRAYSASDASSLPPDVQAAAEAAQAAGVTKAPEQASKDYKVGVDDILSVSVIQPEQIMMDATVSPDGSITFPYIGNLPVKDLTINEIQAELQQRLSDGYLKYPSVVVFLKESRSRKFFVYGAVNKPGPYPMENNGTVLRAISIAGGFSRFGSASRVKVLRPREEGVGYNLMPINIKSVMKGNAQEDLLLQSGDIVVVSEGIM